MEILGNLVHPLKSILVTGELPDSVGDQDDKLPAHQPGLSVPSTQMGEKRHRKGSISHVSRRSQWLARYCRKGCCSSVCSWRGCWYTAQPAPRLKVQAVTAVEFASGLKGCRAAFNPCTHTRRGFSSIILSNPHDHQSEEKVFLSTSQTLTPTCFPSENCHCFFCLVLN